MIRPIPNGPPLLKVEGIRKYFPVAGGLPWLRSATVVRAVDGISLDIRSHETVSLVGESGCGKTTVAKVILLLETPTEGKVTFQGENIHKLRGQKLRHYRTSVQAVFQDPWSSLNPRQRVKDIVGESLLVVKRIRGKELSRQVDEVLAAVGLEFALASSFPHELSGGMRQRVAVARALSLRPSLVVLDEPLSALDVSIQAQIMNLLKDLQAQFGMAYLLIAHNLATVRYLSHRVAVMYLGEIVEVADSEELFSNPLHPYSRALISAATPCKPGEGGGEIILWGEVPSPTKPPPGCRFHTRCPFAFERCKVEAAQLQETTPGHKAACHLYGC